MFYQYKKFIISCCFIIWSIILFFSGVSFGSPQKIITTSSVQIDSSKLKKANEEVTVKSMSDGEITYVIRDLTYTADKRIIFNLQIVEMTAYNYLIRVKDTQNQDVAVKQIDYNKEENKVIFQFSIPESAFESDMYILVFPTSEETFKTKKLTDKAHGKTLINIATIRQQTIDKLK